MSVRQVAKMAGVSIATVSRVLNGDPGVTAQLRETVLAAANTMGYAPRSDRSRSADRIALLYTQEMTLSHPYDAAVLDGLVRGLDDARFDLAILNLSRDKEFAESYTQFFVRKGVRAVAIRTMAATRDVCREIAAEGFPHIVLSERFEDGAVDSIDGVSRTESQRAVEYLVSLGHRRIAFAMHNIPDRDHLDRYEGYRDALAAHELVEDERIVFRHPFTLAGGATVLNMICSQRPRPTAVFFADPMMAVGAVRKAAEIGLRIPDDLSVVGFDDTNVRFSVHPTMTAVCQNAEQIGFEAAQRMLRKLLTRDTQPIYHAVPTFLEINGSTGPAPEAGAVEDSRSSGVRHEHGMESRAAS